MKKNAIFNGSVKYKDKTKKRRKVMKKTKILSLILVCMMLISVFATTVQAASTYTNQTISTNTNFHISDTGLATVSLCYEGYEGLMTNAKMTIVLSKRKYLLFWDKFETVIFYSTDITYIHNYKSQLPSSGTWKCEVEYCISGTGGADDILTFEDTESF
jgi:hypothetical protein